MVFLLSNPRILGISGKSIYFEAMLPSKFSSNYIQRQLSMLVILEATSECYSKQTKNASVDLTFFFSF